MAEGLCPEAADQWHKVQREPSLKGSRCGIISMRPSLFNILTNDMGSGIVGPSESWQMMERLRQWMVVPRVRGMWRLRVKGIS